MLFDSTNIRAIGHETEYTETVRADAGRETRLYPSPEQARILADGGTPAGRCGTLPWNSGGSPTISAA